MSRNLILFALLLMALAPSLAMPYGYYGYESEMGSEEDEIESPVQMVYFRGDLDDSEEEIEARVEEIEDSGESNRRARIFVPFAGGDWGALWRGTPWGYGSSSHGHHHGGHSLTGFHHSHPQHYDHMYAKGHNQGHHTYYHNGFYTEVHK